MRFSARVIAVVLSIFCLMTVLPTSFAYASNVVPSSVTTNQINPTNQHEWVQSVMLDVTSAVICQIVGIDPATATHQCYGAPNTNTKAPQVGGLVGLSTSSISYLYTQPVATSQYVGYLASNFGVGNRAYAAQTNTTTGFAGLTPVLQLWNFSKNLSYLLLTLVFLFIGLGIMLRIKLDPRTVISLQNQIPKVIIGIILITFSYAIVGLLVDVMWTTSYFGINFLASQSSDPQTVQRATESLYNNPLTYVSSIFVDASKSTPIVGNSPPIVGGAVSDISSNGIINLTFNVSSYLGDIVSSSIDGMIPDGGGCSITNLNVGDCVHDAIYFFTQALAILIVGIAILLVLIRIWFMLIKAYAYIIIDTIVAPLWIIAGFIPGSSFGFNTWIRHVIAHLAVFPATIMLILLAKLLLEINTPVNGGNFLPPLIGNLSLATNKAGSVNFGSLLALGVLFLIPELVTVLKDSLKVKSKPYLGKATKEGFAAGMIGTIPVRNIGSNLFGRGDRARGIGPGVIRRIPYNVWGLGHVLNAVAPIQRTGDAGGGGGGHG